MSDPKQLPELRRIVTSHDDKGLGAIQSDSKFRFEKEIPGMDGIKAAVVWVTTDGLPTNDNNNSEDGASRVVNGIVHPNGTNLRCTDLAPGAVTPMHRTSSLDYNILRMYLFLRVTCTKLIAISSVQGELILIMDDGSETHLKNPGDTVIQKGTMHAWRNPSTEWTRWMSAVIAAEPAVVGGKALEDEIRL
ncbi:Cupin-2 domain-containing protein [Mycena sanguinolenta]|uniref:Cupin-2 domain-containing protein n=1 Tax=Mycena sanguinolenta TaxID=230812 RepID=A0A8H6XFJ4_9AGAR|nr:Cupin-2 domain-containing protein [Mycena sanguinolenta]